jgi:dTDP-4-dehydrorhamnose reductase
MVTGASGQLGGHVLQQLCRQRLADRVVALAGHGDVVSCGAAVQRADLGDADGLRDCLGHARPTHLLHLGGITSVAAAFDKYEEARRVNVGSTQVFTAYAAATGARLLLASTDMVFDGTCPPYDENAEPCPTSRYARTKAEAEDVVGAADRGLIVRLPLMYGFPCTPRETTFGKQIQALRLGRSVNLFADEFRTPLWLGDAAQAVIALAASDINGIIHIAGPERLSRFQMGLQFARVLGISADRLIPGSRMDVESPEPRPADLSLAVDRFTARFPHVLPGPIRREVFTGPDAGHVP